MLFQTGSILGCSSARDCKAAGQGAPTHDQRKTAGTRVAHRVLQWSWPALHMRRTDWTRAVAEGPWAHRVCSSFVLGMLLLVEALSGQLLDRCSLAYCWEQLPGLHAWLPARSTVFPVQTDTSDACARWSSPLQPPAAAHPPVQLGSLHSQTAAAAQQASAAGSPAQQP